MERHVRFLLPLLAALLLIVGRGLRSPTHAAGDYTVSGTEVWAAIDNPHVIEGHLTVAQTGHLTLEAGVEVQIMDQHRFTVLNGGTVVALDIY